MIKKIFFAIFILSFFFLCSCSLISELEKHLGDDTNSSEEEEKGVTTILEAKEQLFKGTNLDRVTRNLSFPDKLGKVSISYQSSNEEILSNHGVVTRTDKDIVVNLNVTFTLEEESESVLYRVTILKKGTKTTLSIIEANDVHGYIMQDENGRNGISNMAYLIDDVREEVGKNNVLLIGNGDLFQGTGLVKMSMGQVMIDVMSEMGFDATCLGNHEFDWDLPVILNYFDGNEANGEAKFPLINANVYQNGSLLTYENGQIFESYIFEKGGINVGFIGFIGDVKGSINALFADKYEFKTNFATRTKKIGLKLKEEGADIIVVSIHDGNSDGIEYYDVNNAIANLIDNDGNYLVAACINGHTHTSQSGYIARSGGVAMPVIQSRPYASGQLYQFGRIDLELENNEVISTNTSFLNVSSAGSNYSEDVQNVLDEYYERDKDFLETPIVNATSYISRYSENTYKWVSNVMLAATNADIAICNTGGLRTNLGSGYLSFEDIYQFNPFDNCVIVHTQDVTKVKNFLDSNYYFWSYKNSSLENMTSGTYRVAVIDYVYYGSYYKKVRSNEFESTSLILRDLLIEDLKLRNTFNVNSDYEAKISYKLGPENTNYWMYIDPYDKKHALFAIFC